MREQRAVSEEEMSEWRVWGDASGGGLQEAAGQRGNSWRTTALGRHEDTAGEGSAGSGGRGPPGSSCQVRGTLNSSYPQFSHVNKRVTQPSGSTVPAHGK